MSDLMGSFAGRRSRNLFACALCVNWLMGMSVDVSMNVFRKNSPPRKVFVGKNDRKLRNLENF